MNIYQTLFDLVNTYIFGSTVAVGSYQELVCILVSVVGCLAVFAIPFYVIYRAIRLITDLLDWRR